MTRPDLIIFEAGTLAKASEVNYNFDKVIDYVDETLPYVDTQVATGLLGKLTFADNIVSLSGTTPTLSNNKGHRLTVSGNTTFTLPSPAGTKMGQMLVQITMPSVYTLDLGTTHYFYDEVPSFSTVGNYDIIYEHDGSDWVVGAIYKG